MNEQRPHIMIGQAEVINTIAQPVIEQPINVNSKFTDLKNLNNTWVIVKRHNGNVFFKRRGYVTCLKNYPDKDCLFYDKAQAETEVATLNSVRKKCKYTIENASKYFVNNFNFVGGYWQSNVIIRNEPIPIKEITQNKYTLKSFEKAKDDMESYLKRSIDENKGRLDKMLKDMPIKLKELENQLQNEINMEKAELEKILNKQIDLSSTDFSYVEQYETQGDKLVKVLFSNKPKENKLTTQDSRGF